MCVLVEHILFYHGLKYKTVKDHGHPQHTHWKSKQSYATFIKKEIKKNKGKKTKKHNRNEKHTFVRDPKLWYTAHEQGGDKIQQCSFWRGLNGAQRGWGKWWTNVTIKSAEMLMLYVKCYSRWRDTEAERERERNNGVRSHLFYSQGQSTVSM